ncbi:MAG TPA: beta-galactosidase family protein, partial [Candidatus Acidoferrales bacterium]|nr:beta-galactosidase family protein [Candidatus Acidoferrales bacterium]
MISEEPLLCGEMHYPRIPRAYWEARLKMAHAMGLDAVSTYVFWNLHEPVPGTFDFSGESDVAEFVRTAARMGLAVVLRPGPYVCAEWDLGGLPAWLFAGEAVALRTADEAYMRPVRRWLARLGEELAPLQRSRGGPIFAVQLENEYGAFGESKAYLEAMRDALDAAGFGESPYYTVDQPGDLARGSLPGIGVAATFAPGDPERDLGMLHALRPNQRLICGEYWAGWFDHWAEPHQRTDRERQVQDLEWMLRHDCSVNIYMFHGGTSFGFWNGANATEKLPFQPDTTSYDYDAALDEAGRPTEKYRAFRDAIARVRGVEPRPIPESPRTVEIASFQLNDFAPLDGLLRDPVVCDVPPAMERLGQSLGYVLYRTTLEDAGEGTLDFEWMRDYAVVLLDGEVAGHLDRRLGGTSVRIAATRPGMTLDVLVENGGRINYGPKLLDERKGIGAARWSGRELRGWQAFSLPLDDLRPLRFDAGRSRAPGFWRGMFDVDEPADTFIDVRSLGKGALWINGRNAGRFWNVGSQGSLYVPGVWLKPGRNEAV